MHLYAVDPARAPLRVPPSPEDQELLLRAASGSREAFEQFFHKHRAGLQGFLYRRLRSREEAEDAVVLTFCKAWRARDGFRGNASGKAWLYRIATRVALDMLRRRQLAQVELDALEPDLLDEIVEETVDPERMLLEEERCRDAERAVRGALRRLAEEERQLVRLFYYEGYDYHQIGSLLGISRSQVRGRLHRIRGRLRRDLVDRQQWQPLA